MKIPNYPVERVEVRGRGFSELKSHWTIPLHETNYVGAICTGPGMLVCVCLCVCVCV